MNQDRMVCIDGNEAAASVAYRLNDVIAIYPITPSSAMGELSDEWAAQGRLNLWGAVPEIVEMQSEGGAAGAVHGSLQAGALSTTFTASQGLLLMIPNMYKIAGELTAAVIHVAARSLATHALSIFGDHSDVYACRQTGFAMLSSCSVQEAQDLACIAHAATLHSRIPFLHFFDGFRTSHEVNKIEPLSDETLRLMVPEELVESHRSRALTPDKPVVRGTAQNPDVFFQAREAANPFFDACPRIVQDTMEQFVRLTGRSYNLFDYHGHPEADRVIIMMGSGSETVHELVDWMVARGEKVGMLKVRLFRPFSVKHFITALPSSVRRIAVLDRTKEPGAIGEPLYQDIVTAISEASAHGLDWFTHQPEVFGGRYGLSSKEFNSASALAVFDELALERPRKHFTVGIMDDVTHLSLPVQQDFDIEEEDVFRAVFFGLGSDGTVSANKNSIKIIGEDGDRHVQGYFVYDSKKSGTQTISHLRFSPRPVRAPYLIRSAHFVACHQWMFLDRYDFLDLAAPGAVFLVNSPFKKEEIWDRLPREAQETILEKNLRFYAIDAYSVAREIGMGRHINSIMQTCFFAISGVLPQEQAIASIKEGVEKSYGRKGKDVVAKNFEAIDRTLENLFQVEVPDRVTSMRWRPPIISEEAPDFVQRVTGLMLAGKGDLLPVSAFVPDGTWPTATSRWEKRNIALDIPVWDPDICIQCNKCALVCPHAAIRTKVYPAEALEGAPASFQSMDYRGKEFSGWKYTVQVAPEDCTGCTLCVHVCPAKDKVDPTHKSLDMAEQLPLLANEKMNYGFFAELPEVDRTAVKLDVKGSQFLEPLFEFSGACAGCGETPYIKLLTQLFGDRLLVANATGCSSIYGGNLPTTPYAVNCDGRGPAWSNSLFEDNAEFGLGFRLAVDKLGEYADLLLKSVASEVGEELVAKLLATDTKSEEGIKERRSLIEVLRQRLAGSNQPEARRLEPLADYLIRKCVWLVGGDGWAYDIGYGGLDHVLAMNRDLNVLVMNTGVYSNTGGQASKATPLGATAKFAFAGKEIAAKDLGLLMMTYGNIYVAQIAFGAKDSQTVRAFVEAESYPGSSLIIAYSTCIAQGYDLGDGLDHMRLAVDSGLWPLYRFDPRRTTQGANPLVLDSKAPSVPFEEYARTESRFKSLMQSDPERAKMLLQKAEEEVRGRYRKYQQMADMTHAGGSNGHAAPRPKPVLPPRG